MNGKLVEDATSLERSETLAAVADAPFMDLNEQIETLYLATLSRRPNGKELARLGSHVHGARGAASEASRPTGEPEHDGRRTGWGNEDTA